MDVAAFDYELPSELIAQSPAPRGQSRLLVLDRGTGETTHRRVSDLPGMLGPGDVLVLNDTRVIAARLLGRRVGTGGAVECLLLERLDAERWRALMHPGQKLRVGARVAFSDGATQLEAEVLARHFYGRRTIRLWAPGSGDVMAAIETLGRVPLPPYIKREPQREDREWYQTVYACDPGSVAAPTAGLHFTGELLDELTARGVQRVHLTLHVGYGTFQPVRVARVEEHRLHPETYEITAAAAGTINQALSERRRVIAVGTTTTRALEASALEGDGRVRPGRASTDLFVYPGYRFAVVGALLTNFHLPRSSLLMLVCAFGGRERVLHAYREAVAERYRFYSYGDAMFVA